MATGVDGALNGFTPSPADAWHQDITQAAVDPSSAKILSTGGDLGGAALHADFGGPYGIPYTVVDSSTQPLAPVNIDDYPDESDITLAPLAAGLAIEGSPSSCVSPSSDQHMLVLDRKACVLYEYWSTEPCGATYSAGISAVWDMTETEARPYGYTSADAAGLSVFEGIVRYDEAAAGTINHAIRFTASNTLGGANGSEFVAPATHGAATSSTTDNIMGMRLRLKASFDISSYSATNQAILTAMKTYGLILADNGSNLFFQGTQDSRWDLDDLGNLHNVPASAFDVIQMGPVYTASTAPQGAAPVINSFTASSASVSAGSSVTLTAAVTGASYSYIDKAGFLRGTSIVVTPSTTTTYLLTSRNAYGTTSQSVTVTVTP